MDKNNYRLVLLNQNNSVRTPNSVKINNIDEIDEWIVLIIEYYHYNSGIVWFKYSKRFQMKVAN